MAKRVKSHVLEKTIGALMVAFGLVAIYLFFQALQPGAATQDIAIIEILLIIVLAILTQTVVLIRIYEQNQK